MRGNDNSQIVSERNPECEEYASWKILLYKQNDSVFFYKILILYNKDLKISIIGRELPSRKLQLRDF